MCPPFCGLVQRHDRACLVGPSASAQPSSSENWPAGVVSACGNVNALGLSYQREAYADPRFSLAPRLADHFATDLLLKLMDRLVIKRTDWTQQPT